MSNFDQWLILSENWSPNKLLKAEYCLKSKIYISTRVSKVSLEMFYLKTKIWRAYRGPGLLPSVKLIDKGNLLI